MSGRTQQHVLYLADEALASIIVGRDGTRDRQVFDRARPDDHAVLQRLQSYRHLPTRLVVDLADEAVEVVTLAATMRRDRESLAQRAVTQRHATTPFRFANLTARNRAVLAAVSRPEVLACWLEALDQIKLPLVGVHSATVLWAGWVAGVVAVDGAFLMVTSLPSGAVRLTAIDGKVPVFSRVAPIDPQGTPSAWARAMAHEAARTAQYLREGGRWAESPEAIETIVLVHPHVKADLHSVLGPVGARRFRLVDFDEAGHALGLRPATSLGSADELFAAMLAKGAVCNHYAPPQALRHALFRQSRRVIGALAAATALGGIVISTWNLFVSGQTRDADHAAGAQITAASAERDALAGALPPLPASTAFLEQLASLHTRVLGPYPELDALLLPVSHVLARYPEVRLTQLAWQVADDPNLALSLPQPASDPPGSLRSPPAQQAPRSTARPDAARLPSGRLAIALLEGRMPPPGGDVSSSLQRLTEMVAAISSLPGVQAELVDRPLDDASSARIEGRFAEGVVARDRGRFTLRVTWRRSAPA